VLIPTPSLAEMEDENPGPESQMVSFNNMPEIKGLFHISFSILHHKILGR